MSNSFYSPGEQRAQKVSELFGRIARRYDLMNDVQSFGAHRRWKRKVVELAHVQSGEKALDVCCGTGDIALMLAERGAEVTGLDFSEPMLKVAEEKKRRLNPKSGITNPMFQRGDALNLPFANESFDIVTIGYGLRNLADWERGLEEMARVTKPAGRLVVLDFGKPPNALWRAIYFGYLRLAVPILGLFFAGSAEAYAYILESLKHFPAQKGIEQKMRALGLVNVRVVNPLGGVMGFNYGERR